jgi:DNA-directed RNA polymerase specialized sigma24 family protein
VSRSNKANIAAFRGDYAKHGDFRDVFENDMKSLYLLAFLLTANHKQSEQCFGSTVEEAFKEHAVFKEWARSWVKRGLIENAIEIVSPASARNGQKLDVWASGQYETQRACKIDTVTKLAAFERFVFVMSILERYSNWDCSLLLGCSVNTVTRARVRALRNLPDLAATNARGGELPWLPVRASSGTRGL